MKDIDSNAFDISALSIKLRKNSDFNDFQTKTFFSSSISK